MPSSLPGAKDSHLIHHVVWSFTGNEPIGSLAFGETHNEDYQIDIYGREDKIPYVAPYLHKKPRIGGYHRAIVIAPQVEEWSDKDKQLGRVKVRFLWDKYPDQRLFDRPEYTCWVRLVTPFAGKDHGFYVMPEVGDEVVMSFEDGDIDRPVCVGSVYNIGSQLLLNRMESSLQQMELVKLKTPKHLIMDFWEAEDADDKQRIEVDANQKIIMTMTIDGKKIAYHLESKGTSTVHSVGVLTENSDEKVIVQRGDKGVITIDKEGNISIEGRDISIKGRNISIEAQSKMDIKAANLKSQTSGVTDIKASLIKLNS